MSGDNEIEKFRIFFANMETGDLMKGFLKSMEGKSTPKKLEILIETLKNFDNLYRGKSKKVKEDVYYRMMGAMNYLLSRQEERKEARANETHRKVKLRNIMEEEYNREMKLRDGQKSNSPDVATVLVPSSLSEEELVSMRNTSPDVATVLVPSSLSEEELANVRKAHHSDHEQEEEKTGCGISGCSMMGGNKSRKTRRKRKTKKYKKRKTRKNTKKRKTNQKRKTRGGKKNKRKKKRTRKR